MATRNKYHVTYSSNARWEVKKEKSSAVLASKATKQDAIDAGVAICKRNKPSQLIIHKMDGTIESERTYENDPHPPAG